MNFENMCTKGNNAETGEFFWRHIKPGKIYLFAFIAIIFAIALCPAFTVLITALIAVYTLYSILKIFLEAVGFVYFMFNSSFG